MDLEAVWGGLRLSPDATVLLDEQLSIVKCNDRAEGFFELHSAGAKPLAVRRWLTLESQARVQRLALSDLESVEGIDLEVHSGSVRHWLRGVFRKLSLEQGNFLLVALRDRSTETAERERLMVKLGRLTEAVGTRSIGIYEHDHTTNRIYGSQEVRAHYGLPLDQELSIEVFAGATHPDDADYLVEKIAQAHDPAGDGRFDVRHRILTPSGEVRWLHTCAKTEFSRDGAGQWQLQKTLGSSTVITTTHANELAVRRLAAVLDTTPDVVATTDLGGRLTYLNQAGRLHAGLGATESIANKLFGLLIADDCRESFELAAGVAEREGVWRGELQWRGVNGSMIAVSVVVLGHKQTRSNGAYLSILAHDMTQQKALEEQFLHSQKLEAVGQLAGGIAHDFNNLLSVIFGFASLVSEDPTVPAAARHHTEEVLRAGERAAELTAQLLSFSRRQVSLPRFFSVNQVLRSIEPMVQRLTEEPIEVVMVTASDPVQVHADPHQLEQVLINLVINARDAMPEGGRLTLEVECAELSESYTRSHADLVPGRHVCVSVSDTGRGMSRSVQSRIFEPFFTTKQAGEGTGLGLSTAFGIVRQNGGVLSVCSEPGKGTTFKIFFPATNEPPAPYTRTVSLPRTLLPSGGGVVLVVEDEPQVRSVLVKILTEAGFEPIAAAGPVEGLEIVRSQAETIDILLTDIVMPQMSGKELSDKLSAEGHLLPVLFMSGYAENIIVSNGVLESGLNFLPKPFTPAQLTDAVARVIAGERVVPEAMSSQVQ